MINKRRPPLSKGQLEHLIGCCKAGIKEAQRQINKGVEFLFAWKTQLNHNQNALKEYESELRKKK